MRWPLHAADDRRRSTARTATSTRPTVRPPRAGCRTCAACCSAPRTTPTAALLGGARGGLRRHDGVRHGANAEGNDSTEPGAFGAAFTASVWPVAEPRHQELYHWGFGRAHRPSTGVGGRSRLVVAQRDRRAARAATRAREQQRGSSDDDDDSGGRRPGIGVAHTDARKRCLRVLVELQGRRAQRHAAIESDQPDRARIDLDDAPFGASVRRLRARPAGAAATTTAARGPGGRSGGRRRRRGAPAAAGAAAVA